MHSCVKKIEVGDKDKYSTQLLQWNLAKKALGTAFVAQPSRWFLEYVFRHLGGGGGVDKRQQYCLAVIFTRRNYEVVWNRIPRVSKR